MIFTLVIRISRVDEYWSDYYYDRHADINQLAMVVLVLPTVILTLMGQRIDLYFALVSTLFHEAGHILVQIFTSDRTVIAAAGTATQAAVTVLPSLYLIRDRRTHAAAAAFLMCASALVMASGHYMSTALTMDGVNYLGQKLTASRHDWTQIYHSFGIPLADAQPNGRIIETAGEAAAWVFLASSLLLYASSLLLPGRLNMAHAVTASSIPFLAYSLEYGDPSARYSCILLLAAGALASILPAAAGRLKRADVLYPPSL